MSTYERKEMKIDLHVHIHRTANCSKEEPEAMAKAAVERGIQGIVILDHNYQATKEECKRTESLVHGIRVFRGIEVNVADEDVVIISNEDTHNFGLKYKEKIADIKKLADWVEATNSLAILAHPYRRSDIISFDLNVFKPHAVEFAGRHVAVQNRPKIIQLAKQYRMNLISVSDAHKGGQLGGFCIETMYAVNNEEDLIRDICGGMYQLLEMKLVPVEFSWDV